MRTWETRVAYPPSGASLALRQLVEPPCSAPLAKPSWDSACRPFAMSSAGRQSPGHLSSLEILADVSDGVTCPTLKAQLRT